MGNNVQFSFTQEDSNTMTEIVQVFSTWGLPNSGVFPRNCTCIHFLSRLTLHSGSWGVLETITVILG